MRSSQRAPPLPPKINRREQAEDRKVQTDSAFLNYILSRIRPTYLWMRPLTSDMTEARCPLVAVRTIPGRSMRVRSGNPGACTWEVTEK